MDDTTRNGGFHVAGTTGDVDPHGDIVGVLVKRARRERDPVAQRLRAACWPESPVDVDEHVGAVLTELARMRGRRR